MGTSTLLFVDQVGSTEQLTLLGDVAGQQVRQGLLDLLRQATEVHGGQEVEFTGDGLFCAFDSATDAVGAAVTMQQAVTSFSGRQPEDRGVSIRIGLNTGEPLESEGGGFFGAAVVIAARLCARAGHGQILASDITRSLVQPRGMHQFEPAGELRLKGFPEPVAAYAVAWEPDDRRPRLPPVLRAALRGPFVGRDREMAAIRAAWEGATDGRRQLVLISGDTGLGASRLAAEGAAHLHASGASVWAGAAQGVEARLAPWTEALDGWTATTSRAELRLAVGDKGGQLLPLIPGLSRLLPRLPTTASTDAETDTFLVADAIDAVSARWSALEPLVVVLDRLHEADPASLAVLRRLLHSRRGGQVMVIGCYEPCAVGTPRLLGALGDVPRLLDLRLEGLAEPQVRELIEAVTGEPAADAGVRAVLAESEGVPSYVLRMARCMREERIVTGIEDAVHRSVELRTDLRLQREEIALGLRQLDQLRDDSSTAETARVESDGTPPAPGECPYRGLLPFTCEDAETFFGREVLTAEMVAALTVSRWLAVVGPSGSGKSSVVRAGLQPAVADGALPGSRECTVVHFRPGDRPLEALGAALAQRSEGDDAATLAGRLWSAPLAQVAGLSCGPRRLVVIVDQFEELWTLAPAPARERVLDLLVEAATAPAEWVAVVVTVRADHYGRTAEHPALATLMAESQVLVPPMSRSELRSAVESPARRAGLVLEPGLAQAVLDDVADEPGALPLLSTAMRETWERRRGRSLTLTGYAETGGARRAIAHVAEATLGSLEPGQQEVARGLLLRLAAPSAEGGDVARPAPLSELVVDEDTRTVLERLVDRRLVTTSETTAQVAHEALLREWPRLRAWLDADRDGRRLHQQIATATVEWQSSGEDDGALLRGARLAAAADWRVRAQDQLTEPERRFLDTSARRHADDLLRARRTTRRFQALVAVLVVLLGGAGAATVVAVERGRAAAERAEEAVARDLVNQSVDLATSRLDTALLLAVEAHRRDPSMATESALLGALDAAQHLTAFRRELPRAVVDSATASDGRSLYVLTPSGDLLSYDTANWTATPTTVARAIPGPVSLDVSPDGERAVYVDEDGAHVVDTTGGPSRLLRAGSVTFARFSADGRFVLLREGASEPRLLVMDASSADAVLEYPAGDTTLALVRPGHDQLLVSRVTSSDRVVLQRLEVDGTPLGAPVTMPWPLVLDWRYTNDGSHLVVAAGDRSVTVLDADTLEVAGSLTPPDGSRFPHRVRPAPSGDTVAVGYDDGSVGVAEFDPAHGLVETFRTVALQGKLATPHWLDDDRLLAITPAAAAEFDLRTPTPLGAPLDGPAEGSFVQAFTPTPDGRQVLYVADGRLRRTDASGAAEGLDVALPVDPAGPAAVTVSPDGSWAAVTGHVGGQERLDPDADEAVQTVVVVPLETDGDLLVRRFLAPLSTSMHTAFSPDSSTLAFFSGERDVTEIDVRSGRSRGEPARFAELGTMLEYSSDGKLLLVVDVRGLVWPLDVATRRVGNARELTPGTAVVDMVRMSRGHRLVAATLTGQIVVADSRTARPVGTPLEGGLTPLAGLAVSPAGDQLAAVDMDGSLHLWDLGTGRGLAASLRIGAGTSLGYLDGGRRLVTSSPTVGLVTWDLRPDSWRAIACRVADRDLTRGEWATFLPGEPYRSTCRRA